MSVTLVLDAMGVIFESADDVVDLLQPFIITHGGEPNPERVSDLYTQASLGHIAPDKFWQSVGLNPAVEDEYLSLHRLTAGLQEFLNNQPESVANIWCLSNDVGRWSSKLRRQFQLDDFLTGAIISGDVGSRKPDPAIYHTLLSRIGVAAEQVVFVDDRPKNLTPAGDLGIRTVHFGVPTTATSVSQFSVRTFVELADVLQRID
jgi:HAD superfamily hydrolase (TIGR01509 family)